MNDRELLEAAARAAGIDLGWDARGAYEVVPGVSGSESIWSPLTDDGDAFRLAVKLDMHCVDAFPVPSMALVKECGGDQYAATRRSIVLAAARMQAIDDQIGERDGAA